jgi:hypothetical protein
MGALCPRLLPAAEVYRNAFHDPPGTRYPEWSSGDCRWTANRAGTADAGSAPCPAAVSESPNGKLRFLGEFGGPKVLANPPYDPDHFITVSQAVRLTLERLPAHRSLTISFDLLILKSWDGNNPIYGPDRWKLALAGGPVLLDTSFSNNFKTGRDLSLQDYPGPGSKPQTGAAAVNSLGYTFFGDAVYRISFAVPHSMPSVVFEFSSSLVEGKGLADESWGLANVVVRADEEAVKPPAPEPAPAEAAYACNPRSDTAGSARP